MHIPTVIVVQESFSQPFHYLDFTSALNRAGLTKVRVPQLPSSGCSPPEDAFKLDVRRLKKTIEEDLYSTSDVVLIVHGYGGVALTAALSELSIRSRVRSGKILGIVFVAAVVPAAGESVATAQRGGFAPSLSVHTRVSAVRHPATLFSALNEPSTIDSAVANITLCSTPALTTAAVQQSWIRYPTVYVKCSEDNLLSVEEQEHAIVKLMRASRSSGKEATVLELWSDHFPFLCTPDRLAQMVKSCTDRWKAMPS